MIKMNENEINREACIRKIQEVGLIRLLIGCGFESGNSYPRGTL